MEYYAPLRRFNTDCKTPTDFGEFQIISYDHVPHLVIEKTTNKYTEEGKYEYLSPFWMKYSFPSGSVEYHNLSAAFDFHFYIITLFKVWHDIELISAPIVVQSDGILRFKSFHLPIVGPGAELEDYYLRKEELSDFVRYINSGLVKIISKKNMMLFLIGSADFHAFTIYKMQNFLNCLDGLLSLQVDWDGQITQTVQTPSRRIAVYGSLVYW